MNILTRGDTEHGKEYVLASEARELQDDLVVKLVSFFCGLSNPATPTTATEVGAMRDLLDPKAAYLLVIERLLQERGFQLAKGTYRHGNGDTLPTLVITRPDTPEWKGVWTPWEAESECPGEVAGEVQAAFELAGVAIACWDDDAWMFCKERPDSDSRRNETTGPQPNAGDTKDDHIQRTHQKP